MLDLMAIVSHELKSPLATVQTTAATLHRGYFGKLDPEQEKVVETILRNCEYLEDTIRTYIDLSKMELDGLSAFKERLPFASTVLAEALGMPGVKDNLRRMPIVTEFEGDPVIEGDPALLKIVVGNLVNNAIKYGYEGTPVRLRLARKGGEVVFSVRNEGVGISEEDIANRLFKRFERLKQKGTGGVKGSGLGLYICKSIVDKHQGRIWAESEPGQWVEFFVALPAAAAAAPAPAADAQTGPRRPRSRRMSLIRRRTSGNLARRLISTWSKEPLRLSKTRSLFIRREPLPRRYLMTSMAWRQPMTPQTGPRTAGASSFGISGKRHFRQGVRPGTSVVTCP